MNRDPRYADVERLIGGLTASIGAGSFLPWPSRLLTELQKYAPLDILWTALFLIVGVGLAVASYLDDLRLRIALVLMAGLLWALFIVAAWVLKMPVLLISSVVMVWTCLRVAQVLKHER